MLSTTSLKRMTRIQRLVMNNQSVENTLLWTAVRLNDIPAEIKKHYPTMTEDEQTEILNRVATLIYQMQPDQQDIASSLLKRDADASLIDVVSRQPLLQKELTLAEKRAMKVLSDFSGVPTRLITKENIRTFLDHKMGDVVRQIYQDEFPGADWPDSAFGIFEIESVRAFYRSLRRVKDGVGVNKSLPRFLEDWNDSIKNIVLKKALHSDEKLAEMRLARQENKKVEGQVPPVQVVALTKPVTLEEKTMPEKEQDVALLYQQNTAIQAAAMLGYMKKTIEENQETIAKQEKELAAKENDINQLRRSIQDEQEAHMKTEQKAQENFNQERTKSQAEISTLQQKLRNIKNVVIYLCLLGTLGSLLYTIYPSKKAEKTQSIPTTTQQQKTPTPAVLPDALQASPAVTNAVPAAQPMKRTITIKIKKRVIVQPTKVITNFVDKATVTQPTPSTNTVAQTTSVTNTFNPTALTLGQAKYFLSDADAFKVVSNNMTTRQAAVKTRNHVAYCIKESLQKGKPLADAVREIIHFQRLGIKGPNIYLMNADYTEVTEQFTVQNHQKIKNFMIQATLNTAENLKNIPPELRVAVLDAFGGQLSYPTKQMESVALYQKETAALIQAEIMNRAKMIQQQYPTATDTETAFAAVKELRLDNPDAIYIPLVYQKTTKSTPEKVATQPTHRPNQVDQHTR